MKRATTIDHDIIADFLHVHHRKLFYKAILFDVHVEKEFNLSAFVKSNFLWCTCRKSTDQLLYHGLDFSLTMLMKYSTHSYDIGPSRGNV